MSTTKRKPYRVLSNLRIDEISAVDVGAGEGVKILMAKRATNKRDKDRHRDTYNFFAKIFGAPMQDAVHGGYPVPPVLAADLWREAEALRKNTDDVPSDFADDNDDDDKDDDDNGSTEHFLAGSPAENEATGSTDQLERAESAMKEKNMRPHSMSDVVKKYGILALCKSVERGGVSISEHELTTLISEHAQRTGTTFAKLFEAQDEQGVTLRKAIVAARDAQFLSRTTTMSKAEGMPGRATLAPRVTGGRAAQRVDDPRSALEELQKLVDAQRAANPALSESAAWLSVYTDPKNAELAARERAENRPVATAW